MTDEAARPLAVLAGNGPVTGTVIGRELARQFAAAGWDLIVAAGEPGPPVPGHKHTGTAIRELPAGQLAAGTGKVSRPPTVLVLVLSPGTDQPGTALAELARQLAPAMTEGGRILVVPDYPARLDPARRQALAASVPSLAAAIQARLSGDRLAVLTLGAAGPPGEPGASAGLAGLLAGG